MAIWKRCPMCGRRIPEGTRCGRHKREHARPEGTRKLYHTSAWRRVRDAAMARQGHLDQVALSEGRAVPAELVHHIVPVSEDPGRMLDPSNLVAVSRETHDRIHEAYSRGGDEKRRTQERLSALVRAAPWW